MPRQPDWLGMGELCLNKALGRKTGKGTQVGGKEEGKGKEGGEGGKGKPSGEVYHFVVPTRHFQVFTARHWTQRTSSFGLSYIDRVTHKLFFRNHENGSTYSYFRSSPAAYMCQ